jgi:hypothetical protein
MTVSSDEFVSAIAKLNDLTRRRLIKWERLQPIKLADSIGLAYDAVYDGRRLRIVEYTPPRVRGFFQSAFSADRAYGATPSRDVALEIIDDQGQLVFEFPKVQGTVDLFETVTLQNADIESFIRSLISSREAP